MLRSLEGLVREGDDPWKSDRVDAVALALVVEKEARSQKMWEGFRSWKRQENGFSQWSPKRNTPF